MIPIEGAARRKLERTSARLREISDALAKNDALYAERVQLFRDLSALGLTHREIGEIAGIGWQAVSKALRKEATTS